MKETRGDLIAGRARISGLDVKHLSKKAGMAKSTVYKRLRLPGTMTIDELTSLDSVIHFTDEEIIRIIRNK